MTILKESADLVARTLGDTLHDITIERLVVGLFFTGVRLSDRSCGLCFTPAKDIPDAVCCPSSAGTVFDPRTISGTGALDLLSELDSRQPLKTAVAIATLNALSQSCWTTGLKGGYTVEKDVDAVEVVEFDQNAQVVLVGAMVPVLRRLKQRGGPWWVVEQDPRTLKGEELAHLIPSDHSMDVIHQADVLVVTGATLVNHTLGGVLEAARRDAKIAVIGPTASMLPDPLFERGVDLVGGVWVNRGDDLLNVLAAGGSGYHFLDSLVERVVLRRQAPGEH